MGSVRFNFGFHFRIHSRVQWRLGFMVCCLTKLKRSGLVCFQNQFLPMDALSIQPVATRGKTRRKKWVNV
jgi:hypothetical protein